MVSIVAKQSSTANKKKFKMFGFVRKRISIFNRKVRRMVLLAIFVFIVMGISFFKDKENFSFDVTLPFGNVFTIKLPFPCSQFPIPFCMERNKTMETPSVACNIPRIQPFHKSIKQYINSTPPKDGECLKNEVFLLFNSTLDSKVVPVISHQQFQHLGIISCCYKVISRKQDKVNPDSFVKYSEQCFQLSLQSPTKIPNDHEFVAIFCTDGKNRSKIVDFHPFVTIKPNNKIKNGDQNLLPSPSVDRLNVVILGIDSVSRMNFIRAMPKTYNFLLKDLEAIEMQGYNKMAMNTFTCLLPMLTSYTFEKVKRSCGKTLFYDSCPLIWKSFSKKGYTTGFAEDWPSVAIFHYLKHGFHEQPTDYYLRPLALAAEEEFFKNRGHSVRCQGPRFGFQTLLEYMKKFVYRMDMLQKSYFHFTWSTALTHAYPDYAVLADSHVKDTIKWLQEYGHLNNTVFILMSDHGMFWGDIRKTIQGQLEARLPFLYFVLPKSFKLKYPRATNNLQRNVQRLTTALDLHYTLQDLLNIGQLQNQELIRRENWLATQMHNPPTGISQFLRIPVSRTCSDAGIEEFYCACKGDINEISVTQPVVRRAAAFVVGALNKKLRGYPQCIRLKLRNITLAQFTWTRNGKNDARLRPAYLINFETVPGNSGFEAYVVEYRELPKYHRWKLSGSVSRSTLYRNQSYCVDDRDLKYYCFCR